MNIPQACQVRLDYEANDLSLNVRELRPVLFKEENQYRCLLGPNMQQGIVGAGNTPDEALADWEAQLKERMADPPQDDEVALYAVDLLKASNKKVW